MKNFSKFTLIELLVTTSIKVLMSKSIFFIPFLVKLLTFHLFF